MYRLGAAYLFGPYARGEAGDASDIDLLIDKDESKPIHVYALGEDLRGATGKRANISGQSKRKDRPFKQNVMTESVVLSATSD